MFLRNKLNKPGNRIGPPGCNPLRNEDRMPILKVVSGDTWIVSAEFFAADGGPANPKNSHIEFVLSENQFSKPIWTGVWFKGIMPDPNKSGLVHISIPRDTTKTLRRGSYMFSARVGDRMCFSFNTQLVGNFLVEYMPTSDQHSIPYRDGTSEIFGGSQSDAHNSQGSQEPTHKQHYLFVMDEKTGLYHKVVAVTDPETGEVNLGISQEGVLKNHSN